METLKIDEKWSVRYDPANNDRPVAVLRHGEEHVIGPDDWKNDSVAMFYALLEARGSAGLNQYARDAHTANVQAGWWTDLVTGERIDRNKGELLCLIHSEISEAMEGERKNLPDDKLPHRRMAEVELVDALIRIFDYAGAFGYDLEGAYREKMAFNASRADHTHEARRAAGGKAF